MTYVVSRGTDEVIPAIIAELNRQRDAAVTSEFHATVSSLTVDGDALAATLADASDLDTAVALTEQLWAIVNTHFHDDLAHATAVSDALSAPEAVDLATSIVKANAIKVAFTAHRAEADVHFNDDATYTTTAADASDQGTLETLLNELKADISAHIANALPGNHIDLR